MALDSNCLIILRFCGSRLWKGHRRKDLSLIHDVWGLNEMIQRLVVIGCLRAGMVWRSIHSWLWSGLEERTPGLPSRVPTGDLSTCGGFLKVWWPWGNGASHRVAQRANGVFQPTWQNCIVFSDLALGVRQHHSLCLLWVTEVSHRSESQAHSNS